MGKDSVLAVLKKAAEDDGFLAHLTDDSTEAVKNYILNWEEKAALSSGDVQWMETRVGKLDERLRTWLDCRLQQEKW